MSDGQLTKGTEIAALEAQRNEDQVRADGSLLGERRASIARVAMVILFAVVAQFPDGPHDRLHTIVGASFMTWSLLILYGVWFRIKGGNVRRAFWIPMALSLVDFSFITTMSMIDVMHGQGFHPAKHAASTAIMISFSIARSSSFHIVFAVVFAEISWLLASYYGSELGTHTTIFVMTAFVVLGFMMFMTNRAVGTMFAGLRQRDNLTRFLPRQVAERVMRAGPNALAPVQREITVLFSDIRGFTGMSEGLEPREVLTMLDDYFGRMSQIVKGHDGVVGKFIGDGLLAFWGVPDRLDDHAVHAVNAARDMRVALREINRYRAQDGKTPIKIGIGVHTGTVAAGMLGGVLQAEYTVIGDAVNVASRIEGLTKEHAVDLLISETTWGQLGGKRQGRRLADVEIRGRKEPVTLYTIDDDAG